MSERARKITREELFEAVWTKPIKALAQEWNTTYSRIVGACQQMDVPRPNQGHWQLVPLGQTSEKDPLPEPTESTPRELDLLPEGERQETKAACTASQEMPFAPPENEGKSTATAESNQEHDPAAAAENAVLDMIRQAKALDFWKERISECHSPWGLAKWFGLDKGVQFPENKLVALLRNIRKDYRAFQVTVEESKDRYNPEGVLLSVAIILREEYEWKDAWEEAWTFAQRVNLYCLSDNASRLYEWAKGPKNTGKLTDRRKIGAQARLRKTYDHIAEHLREIRLKADPDVRWEKEGDLWHVRMRVWFQKRTLVHYQHGPLNPALRLDMREVYRSEMERFRRWLHEEILKSGFPDGTETVGIFDIHSRKTLKTVFSKLPAECGRYGRLPDFFGASRLVEGIKINHNFADGAGPWLVICRPKEGEVWKQIKARLRAKAAELPLERKYVLSADGRALLAWILELRTNEFMMGMTPSLEDRFEGDIGIQANCGAENVRVYAELLVEEINERTEFDLKIIGWHHYSRDETRILVRKKQADLERLVRSVQVFGLSKNRVLDGERVRAVINGLMVT